MIFAFFASSSLVGTVTVLLDRPEVVARGDQLDDLRRRAGRRMVVGVKKAKLKTKRNK